MEKKVSGSNANPFFFVCVCVCETVKDITVFKHQLVALFIYR